MGESEHDKAEYLRDLLRKANQTTPVKGGFIPNWSPPYQAPLKPCTCKTCQC